MATEEVIFITSSDTRDHLVSMTNYSIAYPNYHLDQEDEKCTVREDTYLFFMTLVVHLVSL